MSLAERSLLLREVEVAGAIVDLRVAAGRVAELRKRLPPRPGEIVIEGRGGALLPGLHDHHIHLLALAAARGSLLCGPPSVRSEAELRVALRRAAGHGASGWIRGVGYHESVAGELCRERLDAWVPDVPLRIQHRSGALWMMNSPALRELGLEQAPCVPGVERDGRGRPTGRLFRMDTWVRERVREASPPDLEPLGALLASRGVTGVTDATPEAGEGARALVAAARRRGALPQRLRWMGRASASEGPGEDAIEDGAVKILLDDARLPALDTLVECIRAARVQGRNVAFHCVTRAELVVALASLAEAGASPGDRIEHASVAPPELVRRIRDLGLTVVTQPNFVWERGDTYLEEVEAGDLPWLYPCRSLDAAGVPVGAGTDAPFGAADPWLAMRAAVERRTCRGRLLGAEEAVSPERALALFTTPLASPGGPPRVVDVGVVADLCLLRAPWRIARGRLHSDGVAMTIVDGEVVWQVQPRAAEPTPEGSPG